MWTLLNKLLLNKLLLFIRSLWQGVNLNQQSTVKTACVCVCVYHCAQLSYTTQHRTVLIIFPFILQTVIIAQMLSVGGEWFEVCYMTQQLLAGYHCFQWCATILCMSGRQSAEVSLKTFRGHWVIQVYTGLAMRVLCVAVCAGSLHLLNWWQSAECWQTVQSEPRCFLSML